MSGGFAARCSCFGASLSSCAVCGSSVRDIGGWSPCCLGLVGHLQHLTLIGTLA
ncbi:hypothetical protein PF003_g41055 [Phytophthora fragariae]|nr:hypothetical protein PF003_g41055 [Phytophthora fragariae]